MISGVTSASEPAGTYYIKIYGTSPAVIGTYDIAVQS